jgi:hypothetical protein
MMVNYIYLVQVSQAVIILLPLSLSLISESWFMRCSNPSYSDGQGCGQYAKSVLVEVTMTSLSPSQP